MTGEAFFWSLRGGRLGILITEMRSMSAQVVYRGYSLFAIHNI
jgi:hypothetical protein